VEAIIEEIYKDDIILAKTTIWASFKTNRNKLEENQRE
jgi:hypothetical protein